MSSIENPSRKPFEEGMRPWAERGGTQHQRMAYTDGYHAVFEAYERVWSQLRGAATSECALQGAEDALLAFKSRQTWPERES